MRLFISINFNEETIEDLVNLQAELRGCGIDGNYTKPENLHLTLAFIGEYGNPDEVMEAIENVEFKPVTLEFEGLQHFRDMYFARIKNNPGLESIVRRLRRALSDKGIPFDRKKFRPHITLARKVSFREGALSNLPEDIKVRDTLAERISLMRSERGKNGMIYTEIGMIEGTNCQEA